MTDRKIHTCYNCKNIFSPAIYWFDSLYAENYEKRIIKPFCGPKCVQEWHEASGTREWPNRSHPYPKGEEWQIIHSIDDMNYESD
jgi:hypothetical protein